jgi:glycosyltransferase involved in cell wall biosynthesis
MRRRVTVPTDPPAAALPLDFPLRVLHAIAPARTGGAERVLVQLAAAQRDRGHAVHVFLSLDPLDATDHPVSQALQDAGIAVTVAAVGGRAYGAERQSFRAVLQGVEPSVVHAHGYRADLVDLPVARRRGIACVSSFHGFTGGGWRNAINEWLQLRAARRLDAAIAVADSVAHRLVAAGVPQDVLHLIPNAIAPARAALSRDDARAMLGLPPDVPAVGWIGRLSHEKGPDLMIDALVAAPSLHLAIVGDGPATDDARLRARDRGVAERVTFCGAIPDAARLLAAFDLVALSSRTEGTPMSLLEAMQARCPVVAFAVGGIPNALGDTGVLVPAGDAAALGAALHALGGDPARRKALAAAAATRAAEHFGLPQWLDAHDRAYHSALAHRGLPHDGGASILSSG